MRKNIALIVMCIGIFLFGCSNQKNPSDNIELNNKPVETIAPTEDINTEKEPVTEVSDKPVVEETIKPTEVPTVEPTTEPTVAPTVKPTVAPTKAPVATKAPTKAPVATKAPTKKPVATKTPTKAPTKAPATKTPTATKKPATTKTPNAAGEPYKVGHVTVTPVKNLTIWTLNHGNVRTKPWTGEGSEVIGIPWYTEIKVTGVCSNGFYQYKEGSKTVYIHESNIYTEKPKEFIMKGYDPVKVIKLTHEKLRAKGFRLRTDEKDEVIAFKKQNIAELEADIKAMEDGTYPFPINYSKEKREAKYKEWKEDLAYAKQDLKNYIHWITVELHEHKPITDPDKELGSYQGIFFNQNINRMQISPCLAVDFGNITCEEDIADEIVAQCELNVKCGNAFQNDFWIYYRERKQESGEDVYWFYIT